MSDMHIKTNFLGGLVLVVEGRTWESMCWWNQPSGQPGFLFRDLSSAVLFHYIIVGVPTLYWALVFSFKKECPSVLNNRLDPLICCFRIPC